MKWGCHLNSPHQNDLGLSFQFPSPKWHGAVLSIPLNIITWGWHFNSPNHQDMGLPFQFPTPWVTGIYTPIYPEWPHRQVLASHVAGCRIDSRLRLHWFILYTKALRDATSGCGGCDQSIGSTISDSIVRSLLWSTTTRSSPLGCFRTLLQVVDNLPHSSGSRFFTGRLLAVNDFTFFYHNDMGLPFQFSS